jgi:hypothetical protein
MSTLTLGNIIGIIIEILGAYYLAWTIYFSKKGYAATPYFLAIAIIFLMIGIFIFFIPTSP